MKTLSKLMNGLSTKLFDYLLNKFFKSPVGKDFTDIYGISFDSSIQLSELPVLFPSKEDFYKIANDLGYFEIISIDSDNDKITIRELCTETEYTTNVEFFNLLFIKEDKPDLENVLYKSK